MSHMHNLGSGWIGTMREVLHFLGTMGADRDDQGRFLIYGEGGVASFMGVGGENSDVVIPADTQYSRNGSRIGLAFGLSQTSYGLRVTVI